MDDETRDEKLLVIVPACMVVMGGEVGDDASTFPDPSILCCCSSSRFRDP